MGYEIDYLPVGKSADEKSGDAIAMRFWDQTQAESAVITIDGGTRDSGAALVEHVKKYYHTETVHLAILTHPDGDHASGLRDVLEQLDVRTLVTAVPWRHSEEILPIIQAADRRITAASIETRLREAFPATAEALDYAEELPVEIIEPFAWTSRIALTESAEAYILGPSRHYYLAELLPTYACLPAQPRVQGGLLETVIKAAAKTIQWVRETWDKELLLDPGPDEVNSENNSSIVFFIRQGNEQFLFCGDAGVPALVRALSRVGLVCNRFTFFHLPHHGSRHNIGPSLLNSMFGQPRVDPNRPKTVVVFASATKGDPKHPSRRVTNALNRRGLNVIGTQGTAKWHHSGDAPAREGWVTAEPIPFYEQVEDIEED